jgi:ABC-type branched-subunit amino acid transport system ATPase component/predicted MFS family arabinose efflux permease
MSEMKETEVIDPLFPDPPAPPRRWSLKRVTGGAPTFPLTVLFGLNAVDELDREAFNVLIPNIREHFDLSIQGVLLLSSLVALAVLLLEVPLSHLADRRNRIKISVAGASAWGGFSILTGLAANVPMLGVARAGAGLGRAVNGSTHNSLIADWYPATVRPGVFGFHRAANAVGMFVGPLAAGGIAYLLGWRAPFFILAIPTFILIMMAMRLQEPVRGGQERRALGGDEDTVGTEEAPASFSEAFRVLWAIESLRRIWVSLPIIAIAVIGLTPLIQLYYEDQFGLDELGRGIVAALAEPAQLIGILVGIPIATRLMRRDPSLLITFISTLTVLSALALLVFVNTPNLVLAVVSQAILAAARGALAPGLAALFSLIIPARVRSLGFSVGNFFIIPALAAGPIVGGFADDWGLRPAIMLLIPVLLFGAFLIGSSSHFVNSDIDRAATSTLAMAEVRRARREGDPKLLTVRSLDLSYGQTQVLFDVDFEVLDGEIVALLGTNGAGKSSLLKAISGLAQPQRGVVVFDGRDITAADSVQGARLGITQVPGERGVFPTLTVAEHLRLAGWALKDDPEHVAAATEQVLEYFPVLRRRWDLAAGSLSGGEQQMLSLAQAFIAKPKLLLIDELSLGLAPTVVEQLVGILPVIHANGTAIVLVEQSVHTALRLAQRAVFMEKGEIRFSGPTAELLERHDLVRSMFLEGAASEGVGRGNGNGNGPAPAGLADLRVAPGRTAEPVLAVDDLTKHYGGITAVDSVSLELHDGEILGLIGPNGAGKTTIFDLVSGFQSLDRGTVRLHGEDVTHQPAHVRARLGLGRSFQNARLWPSLTVREAVATACEADVEVGAALPAFLHLPVVADSEAHVAALADDLLELLHLDRYADKFVAELSAGVRRMVDLAVQLAARPSVLLLDEPSSGIAQRETEALGPVLRDVQRHLDCSILIIEHDMPLITALADRLVALDTGRVVTSGPPGEVLVDPRVVESYLGAEWTGGDR